MIGTTSHQEEYVNRLTDNGSNNNSDHHNENDPHLSEQKTSYTLITQHTFVDTTFNERAGFAF